jgi:hypothetical protein
VNKRGNQVVCIPSPSYLSPMPSVALAPGITLVPGYLGRAAAEHKRIVGKAGEAR